MPMTLRTRSSATAILASVDYKVLLIHAATFYYQKSYIHIPPKQMHRNLPIQLENRDAMKNNNSNKWRSVCGHEMTKKPRFLSANCQIQR